MSYQFLRALEFGLVTDEIFEYELKKYLEWDSYQMFCNFNVIMSSLCKGFKYCIEDGTIDRYLKYFKLLDDTYEGEIDAYYHMASGAGYIGSLELMKLAYREPHGDFRDIVEACLIGAFKSGIVKNIKLALEFYNSVEEDVEFESFMTMYLFYDSKDIETIEKTIIEINSFLDLTCKKPLQGINWTDSDLYLQTACEAGNLDLFKEILIKCRPDVYDLNNLVQAVCHTGFIEFLDFLLENNPSIKFDYNMLLNAIFSNNIYMLKKVYPLSKYSIKKNGSKTWEKLFRYSKSLETILFLYSEYKHATGLKNIPYIPYADIGIHLLPYIDVTLKQIKDTKYENDFELSKEIDSLSMHIYSFSRVTILHEGICRKIIKYCE